MNRMSKSDLMTLKGKTVTFEEVSCFKDIKMQETSSFADVKVIMR